MTVFSQHWWLDAVAESWDVALAKKGDLVTGAWPYPIEKKAGVALLRTPILTPYLGPQIFYPQDLKESNRDNFEHETVADLMKGLPPAKVWQLALQPGIKQAGIFKSYNLNTAVQQTFLLDLNNTEETLLANMKENTRRNLRALASDISISNAPDLLGELFRFHHHTLASKKKTLPYSLPDLQRIMDAALANNACALWVAKSGVATEAMVWHMWDNNCGYYFMGGQNPAAGGYKAMSLLLWHAISHSKKLGHKTFDFEGSMDEGVERFFRSFGGKRALYMVLQKNDSLLWKIKQMVAG